MNTGMEPLSDLWRRATDNSRKREQARRIGELVGLIDELSGEMGSADFRDAVRLHGYDIDACTMTLGRRGIEIN